MESFPFTVSSSPAQKKGNSKGGWGGGVDPATVIGLDENAKTARSAKPSKNVMRSARRKAGKQVVASGETVAELDSQCTFSIFPRSKVHVIREWTCVSRYVEVFEYRSEAVTTSRGLCCLQYPSSGGEGTVSVVQIGNIMDSPEADLLIHAGAVDRFDGTAVVRSTGGKFVRVGLQQEFDLQGVYPFRAATVVKAFSVSWVAGGVSVCDVLANEQ
uniref:Uncharacterized protein n=1 Tax=Chromera velia CCMP2878 TaxID=1169474 RepID=A0A0G4F936_9ALVE|eukprot:Cvel_15801.t1-p1 / transcript=Cvel_15801.t1 / gene=Cvel_15801 / organism=Chromera_velia_CCMP2878 / gene_product=hypothetical protein / transcript_product=hypothetical protein / location=Cvel_scaffold1186:48480-49706(-) / protein_length=214 / sequence_SO=supercontig / SO=protein_coding / is_pseudo=false